VRKLVLITFTNSNRTGCSYPHKCVRKRTSGFRAPSPRTATDHTKQWSCDGGCLWHRACFSLRRGSLFSPPPSTS